MKDEIVLRDHVLPSDAGQVRDILLSTGFFSAEEVQMGGELVEERLKKGLASGYFFLFAEQNGIVAGYTCYGNIPCTKGSFDLYWIAVRRDRQNMGLGKRLITETERAIMAMGGQRVYIETSSRDIYASTRAFYVKAGYKNEVVLEDFYAPGDGKHIFSKDLTKTDA